MLERYLQRTQEFLAVVAGATVIVAVGNGLWLMFASGGGRVAETGYYFFTLLLETVNLENLRRWIPQWMRVYHQLEDWRDLASFIPQALLANLPLNMALGGAVCVLGGLAFKSLPRRVETAGGELSRSVVAIFLVASVFLLPAEDAIYGTFEGWSLLSAMKWTKAYVLAVVGGASLLFGVGLAIFGGRGGTKAVTRATVRAGAGLIVVVLAGWLANAAIRPAAPRPAAGPNILLISIDTLRADHLHTYGYPRQTSPNMDRLAAEGVQFQTALAPTSWTLPSHMSLFTGLDPLFHGVISDYTRLSPRIVTVTEVLRQAGYATAGIVSNLYVDARWGFSRGFDHYDDYSLSGPNALARGTMSPAVAFLARRWLDQWSRRNEQRPFFLFLHILDPHTDYFPPPPYNTMFDPDYRGPITGRNVLRDDSINRDMDRRDLEHLIALYDGEIRMTDEQLGGIFEHLRKLGVFDDTVVVVTSDHGEEFFEHGSKGHRKTLYEESLRIPLIFRYPKLLPRGLVIHEQVRLMDVAPTLLRLAGIEDTAGLAESVKEPFAPRDLTPWMITPDRQRPELPALLHLSEIFTYHIRAPLYAVRAGDVKLIVSEGKADADEFYDLGTDPAEQINLAGADGQRAAEAKTLLNYWRRQAGGHSGRGSRLGSRQMELLKSLGYVR